MLAFKDTFEQKAGLSLITQGVKGKGAVYYNGFLSADDYEDDVTLTHTGQTANLGRVCGRETDFSKCKIRVAKSKIKKAPDLRLMLYCGLKKCEVFTTH